MILIAWNNNIYIKIFSRFEIPLVYFNSIVCYHWGLCCSYTPLPFLSSGVVPPRIFAFAKVAASFFLLIRFSGVLPPLLPSVAWFPRFSSLSLPPPSSSFRHRFFPFCGAPDLLSCASINLLAFFLDILPPFSSISLPLPFSFSIFTPPFFFPIFSFLSPQLIFLAWTTYASLRHSLFVEYMIPISFSRLLFLTFLLLTFEFAQAWKALLQCQCTE